MNGKSIVILVMLVQCLWFLPNVKNITSSIDEVTPLALIGPWLLLASVAV